MPKPVDQELIRKFLAGKCTANEAGQVRSFLQKEESEKILDQMLSLNQDEDWKAFDQNTIKNSPQNNWLNTIRTRISQQEDLERKIKFKHIPVFKYAAIWLCVLSATFGIYLTAKYNSIQNDKLVFIERGNPDGQRSKIILADSSIVYLGPGSKLKYPERFSKQTREISLKGEAFFEVSKNPKRPFIIHTGNIATKVLGTSFKIEAFAGKALSVEVATGKVRVDYRDRNHTKSLAILLPGEKVVYFKGEAKTTNVAISEVSNLKDAKLIFQSASLFEISEALHRWYNVKISFKNQRKARERMTLTLDASVSIDKVFHVLAAAGNFKFKIINNEIIIR